MFNRFSGEVSWWRRTTTWEVLLGFAVALVWAACSSDEDPQATTSSAGGTTSTGVGAGGMAGEAGNGGAGAVGGSGGAGASLCVSCLRFVVSRPSHVTGPRSDVPDNLIPMFNTGSAVRGYVANGETLRLEGAQADQVTLDEDVAIGAGGDFDSCGAWLQAVDPVGGSVVRGWYHAEGPCADKKIAYALSTDNGLTFQKPDYPDNLIVTPAFATDPANGTTGEGDHTVIKHGDYYYLYYVNTDPSTAAGAWHTSVARALVTSEGGPGSWYKYHAGAWTEPGLGGEADKLGYYGGSASKYVGSTPQVALLEVDPWFSGLKITFGDIPVGPWTTVDEPLLPIDAADWVRPASTELLAYPSAVHLDGGNEWATHFVLFYLYLQPDEAFDQRYLIRRHVWVSEATTAQQVQVRLSLDRYASGTGSDHWVTTTYAPGYTWQVQLGAIMTAAPPAEASTELSDCYVAALDDHLVGVDGDCGAGAVELRTLGWVYQSEQQGTHPLYRCYDEGSQNHFVSTSSDCEGLGSLEWIMGYAYD